MSVEVEDVLPACVDLAVIECKRSDRMRRQIPFPEVWPRKIVIVRVWHVDFAREDRVRRIWDLRASRAWIQVRG